MYKVKNKKIVFKNSVYKVFSNTISTKDTTIKNYLSLEVAGNKFGGVCCLILLKKKIGLMKVYSPICKKYFYSIPQGFVDYGENEYDAVRREVFEETGFKFKKNIYKKKFLIYPLQSLINSKLAVFNITANEKSEIIEKKKYQKEIGSGKMKFYTKNLVKKLLKKPQNFDLISFAVILKSLNLK